MVNRYPDYLIHHGVKGMRWGHRKDPQRSLYKRHMAEEKDIKKDAKAVYKSINKDVRQEDKRILKTANKLEKQNKQ